MRTVAPEFGIYDATKGIARRSTFVVDRDGKVVLANTAFQPGNREHYEEVLTAVEGLAR